MHAFPWRETEALQSGVKILRPTVDVELSRGAGWTITTKALLDTGAPLSVFPRGVGDLLGITFPEFASEADKRITFLNHDWPAIEVEVDLLLRPFDDLGWSAPLNFVLDDDLAFGVLGYEGFLNRWAVTFNGASGYFLVEPADEFDDRLPDEVLEELRERCPDLFAP